LSLQKRLAVKIVLGNKLEKQLSALLRRQSFSWRHGDNQQGRPLFIVKTINKGTLRDYTFGNFYKKLTIKLKTTTL
jgi:hypothetical protein